MEGGRGGERGREKESGESRGPFWEEGGGLRPRKSVFRAEQEGKRGEDPARPFGGPMPHLGPGVGCLGGHILPRLWPGGRGPEAGHHCLRQKVTESSCPSPCLRQLWPREGQ